MAWLLGLILTLISETVILAPNSHGQVALPQLGATLTLAYGTVNQNTRLTLTETEDGLEAVFQPTIASTVVPILVERGGITYILDAPGSVEAIPSGDYLIYFDTIQVFAQHLDSDTLYSLGMLEGFSTDLPVEREQVGYSVQTIISQQGQHTLIMTDGENQRTQFTSAAHHPHYRNQFVGQDLKNPASFQFLGWASSGDLPHIIRGMISPVADVDLPNPGERETPIELWLPFDCAEDWLVSWGYHFSNHQNRYAVDFAAASGRSSSQGLPIRASHAGTLYLKIFGYDGAYIDLGIAARITYSDGITSTEYGHLDDSTFRFWDIDPEAISPFDWIEVGEVQAGQVIGFVGATGYATGAHIHFALWTYNQSIDRPVFNMLREFTFGMSIPAATRRDCRQYP